MEFKAQEHPDYWLYASMKKRCYCKTNAAYHSYGGRGITVCDRWLMPRGIGFRNFVSDMGPRPDGMTLERKDNNLAYGPGNCIWATMKDQGNNRRTNIRITFNGVTKTATQWAHGLGLRGGDVIMKRIANGIPLEEALTVMRLPRDHNHMKLAIEAAAKMRRARTHCKRGHEYTEENTYFVKTGRGCLTCRSMMAAERYLQKKAA
jgi:hypothetical protein